MRFRLSLQRITRIILVLFILLFIYISTITLSTFRKNTLFRKNQSPAFIITVKGHDQRVPIVTSLFKKYANLVLSPFYGVNGHLVYATNKSQKLTPGQRGLRETMKKFFHMTLVKDYKDVFVIQDDAVPHFNFTSLFKQLPKRCEEADMLLLGATIWSNSRKYFSSGPCFNVDHRVYGAFTLYIKQSAFKPIVDWLEKDLEVPYDHVFVPLQKQGLIVRATHSPFLAIQYVAHPSLVDNNRSEIQFDMKKRALLHGWDLDSYPINSISTGIL